MKSFKDLKGKTLSGAEKIEDEIIFTLSDGSKCKLFHSQDCCEHVSIESITGDLSDLVGEEIIQAEESSSETRPGDVQAPIYKPESETWTFYKMATIKGSVTIRFFGESNGYYSESVDFAVFKDDYWERVW